MIKNLRWDIRADDGVIHSDPDGLQWSYYIYTENEQCFHLKLINEDGYSDENLNSQHESLDAAKNAAQNHFEAVLQQYLDSNT